MPATPKKTKTVLPKTTTPKNSEVSAPAAAAPEEPISTLIVEPVVPIVPVLDSKYAALFIDYENIYYTFKNQYHDPIDGHSYVLDIIRNLRAAIKERQADTLTNFAYADFERIANPPLGPLYLMGIATRYVMGTAHKNAADMQLCIDVLRVAYTRADISTFVLMAGDRDYIPVLQHLRELGRQVLVVGLPESVSGDLLLNVGRENFIDANLLLSAEQLLTLQTHRAEREQEQPKVSAVAGVAHVLPAPTPAPRPYLKLPALPAVQPAYQPNFRTLPPPRPNDADELRVLKYMLTELQELNRRLGVHELWLSPFMRKLTDWVPEFPDHERNAMVKQLEKSQAIRIEKRKGDPYDFSVIILDYTHADVVRLEIAAAS